MLEGQEMCIYLELKHIITEEMKLPHFSFSLLYTPAKAMLIVLNVVHY